MERRELRAVLLEAIESTSDVSGEVEIDQVIAVLGEIMAWFKFRREVHWMRELVKKEREQEEKKQGFTAKD